MTPETKARLRALAAEKRKKKRLLKDASPDDLRVAADWVKQELEAGVYPQNALHRVGMAYLRWASDEQVLALANELPCRLAMVTASHRQRTTRPVVMFQGTVLRAVLAFLVDEPDKYMSRPDFQVRPETGEDR